jgi:hypothetical protein
VTGSGVRHRRCHSRGGRLNTMNAPIVPYYTQNFRTVKRRRTAAGDFSPRYAAAGTHRSEVFLPGETGWTKDFRLLSWWWLSQSIRRSGFQRGMKQPMATHPSVPALAGMRDDCSGRLLLIGIQPLEFGDVGDGLRPAVIRRIEPTIGISPERLARRGIPPSSARQRGERR